MNSFLESLELHKILEMLSNEASNSRTKEMALGLLPVSDLDKVRAEMKKTETAFKLSVKYGTPGFTAFKDIRGALRKASSGASLSLRELLDIGQMLYQVRIVADWYKSVEEKDTVLSELFSSLSPNSFLENKIKDSILSEDEISDMASHELADIRRKIAQAGVRIRESLDKLVKSSEVQKSLQDNIVTVRDGRYVLPVKAEHKGSVPGLVHATSASGSTYFIEPMSVVEANNDIQVLKSREQEEIERIIAELSGDCSYCAETLTADYETCAELDLYFAKSNLGAKMRGSIPEISDDGVTVLKKARHPLIPADKVVPVDISLGEDYNALIVTGPNTGGKTVILKTTGLLTAMAMCGMMIPVSDGSRVSVFDNILVNIGDMQSIEQSLSTFSSHMSSIVNILKAADERSLILLDELGSGTDPVEGAALAVSIIEDMVAKGAKLLVTTHYQELKLFAIETKGIENASCEFDTATMQPTYRLIIGSPGKSNAFSISRKLGVPDDIIERAKSLVSSENRHFEEVVANLEKARLDLEAQNNELTRLKNEQAEKNAAIEKELDELNKRKDGELEKARVQAMRIVESCRMQSDELLNELEEMRKQQNKTDLSAAKSRQRSAMNKMYDSANPIQKREIKEYKLPRPLKRGDKVLVFDIDKTGILSSDPDSSGNVFVQIGIMKTKVSVNRLRLLENDKKVTVGNKKISKAGVQSKLQRKPSLELDIRGCAVDEGIHELDMFIDNAVLSGAGVITVIHGKGTGILRTGIQNHLRSHPSVKSYRAGLFGEGEDGVTIIELK